MTYTRLIESLYDSDMPTYLKTRNYYVYILTNRSGTLYTGVTNDLLRRVAQHRAKEVESFTQSYNLGRLVYYEETSDVLSAIAREKEIKGMLRKKKIALIESVNPRWKDLSEGML